MSSSTNDVARFEQLFLPHLDAAYNLARWLTRNDSAAQDVVQESCLRAFNSLNRFIGGNARAWLLTIVRNQSYTWLKQSAGARFIDVDDQATMNAADQSALAHADTPEAYMTRAQDGQALERAMQLLPAAYREVIVLKELEELSYKEIAAVTGVPLGTVMSRLARARDMLKMKLLADHE